MTHSLKRLSFALLGATFLASCSAQPAAAPGQRARSPAAAAGSAAWCSTQYDLGKVMADLAVRLPPSAEVTIAARLRVINAATKAEVTARSGRAASALQSMADASDQLLGALSTGGEYHPQLTAVEQTVTADLPRCPPTHFVDVKGDADHSICSEFYVYEDRRDPLLIKAQADHAADASAPISESLAAFMAQPPDSGPGFIEARNRLTDVCQVLVPEADSVALAEGDFLYPSPSSP